MCVYASANKRSGTKDTVLVTYTQVMYAQPIASSVMWLHLSHRFHIFRLASLCNLLPSGSPWGYSR